MEYLKKCAICGKDFFSKYKIQNVCNFSCRMQANRENSLRSNKIKKGKINFGECYFCGYNEVTENHHEYINKEKNKFILCPNHHALITRNIKTFKKLEKEYKKL